jgi:hypothetical protein
MIFFGVWVSCDDVFNVLHNKFLGFIGMYKAAVRKFAQKMLLYWSTLRHLTVYREKFIQTRKFQ